ncbi:unnamed protein product, partial [Symbiodinium necroappetens]
ACGVLLGAPTAEVDSRIRILLSQVRSLKKHEDYVRAMRRATEKEKQRIDMVLGYVLYHNDASKDGGEDPAADRKAAPSSGLEIPASAASGTVEAPLVMGRALQVGSASSSSSEEAAASSSRKQVVRKPQASSSRKQVVPKPKAEAEDDS